jgi:hypothetical protein
MPSAVAIPSVRFIALAIFFTGVRALDVNTQFSNISFIVYDAHTRLLHLLCSYQWFRQRNNLFSLLRSGTRHDRVRLSDVIGRPTEPLTGMP